MQFPLALTPVTRLTPFTLPLVIAVNRCIAGSFATGLTTTRQASSTGSALPWYCPPSCTPSLTPSWKCGERSSSPSTWAYSAGCVMVRHWAACQHHRCHLCHEGRTSRRQRDFMLETTLRPNFALPFALCRHSGNTVLLFLIFLLMSRGSLYHCGTLRTVKWPTYLPAAIA